MRPTSRYPTESDQGNPDMPRKPFDIRERTFLFAVATVKWVKRLPNDSASQILARHLIRSVTSIGANIEEADGTVTEEDKVYKWAIARKEARETRYWLRLIDATSASGAECGVLVQEATEIINILSAMIKKHAG